MIQNAVSAYAAARPAVAPGAPGPLGGALTDAAADFAAVMRQTDMAAQGAMTGSADTHQLVQSIAEAQLALETAVAIRDKMVEAYQDILRMPV
ncbi:flagellar hook-basal body complex protein FliE [Paracoccus sp. Z118]|uniref:flagellar hook-basal body complex protein FliE n=1 Tax=Paracoccus sp. Z118 TaxID=2851017 RepID=UPI001C2CADC4|nr:flagellar hook-basal body complex protein FliE [Paracoccus sp. Z118]MBV0891808.1 flagellar hook-basal body complex protein FliE [Paracoccus sp. Z118]